MHELMNFTDFSSLILAPFGKVTDEISRENRHRNGWGRELLGTDKKNVITTYFVIVCMPNNASSGNDCTCTGSLLQ